MYKRQDKKESLELRKKMQIVFQDPYASLDPRKTVFQTISEPLRYHHMYHSEQEVSQRTYELMRTVGLTERYAMTYPHEMDGGRRQRIGIGRALALNPKFIVCDEPVSALDVSIQAQVLNLMQDLQRDLHLTYIFITHDLSVVKHISDEILVMYLGTMVEYGPTEEVYGHPAHPYTQGLLSAVPVADPDYEKTHHRIPMEGEVPSPIDPKPGCRFCGRCPRATEPVSYRHFAACHHLD